MLVLFLFGAFMVAVLWTFVIGLAGMPGAVICHAALGGRRLILTRIGLVLCFSGQTGAALAFAAFFLRSAHHLVDAHGVAAWPLWIAGFFITATPVWVALKDSAGAEIRNAQCLAIQLADPADRAALRDSTGVEARNVQHLAILFSAPAEALGYVVLALLPSIADGIWFWLPELP